MPIGTISSWFPSVGTDWMLAGAQGLEFLKPLKPGQGVGRTYAAVRKVAAPLNGDRPFTADIEQVASGLRIGAFDPEAA